jgi:SAM-dependent methyltransferase
MKERRYPIRSRLFHLICTEPEPHELPADHERTWQEEHEEADDRFFSRMPELSFEGRSVLDYGCGGGTTSIFAAEHGARRVLGVDIGSVAGGEWWLENKYPELRDVIEFRQIEDAGDIGDERFDLVISKNTIEHVADPVGYVRDMAGLLAPDGQLVVGFGALWKSPLGGHIQHMTKFPWAHLLFPETVILRERRRYRPDEDPQRFEDIKGGLNRMTLAKFNAVMEQANLERVYFVTNRNDRLIAKVLDGFSKVPGLQEYFTFSVHSIWRVPAANDAAGTTSATRNGITQATSR